MEKALQGSDKIKAPNEKMDECVAKAIEKDDLNRKRASEKQIQKGDAEDDEAEDNRLALSSSSLLEKRKAGERQDGEEQQRESRRKVELAKGEKRDEPEEAEAEDGPPRKVLVCGLEVNELAEDDWDYDAVEFVDEKSGKVLPRELVRVAWA